MNERNTTQVGCGSKACQISHNATTHGDNQAFSIRARTAQRTSETFNDAQILRGFVIVNQMHRANVCESQAPPNALPYRAPDFWR